MEENRKELKIVLIGAGNLATNLGKALKQTGYRILQVYSRTAEAASVLSKEIGAEPVTSLARMTTQADLYIVSLKDSAFTELVSQITAGREKAFFIHTAGSISMDIWKGYAKKYGVLYPMQTFSKKREIDFQEIPCFLEAGTSKDLQILKSFAYTLSRKVYEADSEQRKFLHLAAVFACNFTNHMYAVGEKLLHEHGLPFETMLPLIDETVRKIHELSPPEAQTGPAVRYDENVIRKHLDMLADKPEWQALYKQITLSIHTYKYD